MNESKQNESEKWRNIWQMKEIMIFWKKNEYSMKNYKKYRKCRILIRYKIIEWIQCKKNKT